jgi:hypothetical protein
MRINDTDPSERGLTHIDVSSRCVPSCNVCRPPQSRGFFFPEDEEGARLGSVGLRHCLLHAGHGVGMWFRPLVAKRLKEEGIASDDDLLDFCNARGRSWWMSMPRIGVGRARHVAFVVASA